MSKSLDFIKSRGAIGKCEYGFERFIQECTSDDIQMFYKNNNQITTITQDSQNNSRKAMITYDENANFEYYTNKQCTCDGTLMFYERLMLGVFESLLRGETYNNTTMPSDYHTKAWDYDIKYTVGNFVFDDEYGDFGTKEKPWLHSRFTAMLPIKIEYIRH